MSGKFLLSIVQGSRCETQGASCYEQGLAHVLAVRPWHTGRLFRDDSGGSFLAVTCGNGHIALAGLINSFWCRIVWDSVIVHLSLWEIMSDLAVANLGIENHGVECLWAAPAGLTATAHDALEKAHT